MKRSTFATLLCAGAAAVMFACCGGWYLVEVPFRLAVGWIDFAARTLPRVSVNWVGVATFAALLAAFVVVLHRFGRAVWPVRTVDGGDVPGWTVRRTAVVTGLTLTLFAAGLAATGVGHQIGWLVTAPVPVLESNRQAVKRSQSQNQLKQIELGLYNYQSVEEYARFPAGGTYTDTGRGLHGWIAASLPFLDAEDVWNRIDFDRPWDDAVNAEPFGEEVYIVRSPSLDYPTHNAAGYALAHYAGNAWVLTDGAGLSLAHVTDGTTVTLLAGEVGANFLPWGHPANTRDPALGIGHPQGFGGPFRGGSQFTFVDGSVRFLSETIDPAVLRALGTPAGGEAVGGDDF